MLKARRQKIILSVYCPDTECYPYYPFVAEGMFDGIQQYIKFLSYRDKICPNPELHVIGHCTGSYGSLEDIQPLMAPQKVELSDNFLSWTLVHLTHLSIQLKKYLERIGILKNVESKKTD